MTGAESKGASEFPCREIISSFLLRVKVSGSVPSPWCLRSREAISLESLRKTRKELK